MLPGLLSKQQLPVGYVPRPPITQIPTPGVPQNLPDPLMMTMGNHMVPAALGPNQTQAQGLLASPVPGPYAAQAQQLAGLLGGGATMPLPVMRPPYTPGRFMPGFRPGIDQPLPSHGGRPTGPVRPY